MSAPRLFWFALGFATGCSGSLTSFPGHSSGLETRPVTGRPTGSTASAEATDTGLTDPASTAAGPLQCHVPTGGMAVCVTELQAENDATLERAPGVFGDWLELLNRSAVPVPSGQVVIRLGNDELLLPGGDLQPGEHRVVWLGDEAGLPGLSTEGETVEVEVAGLAADRVELPPSSSDTAYALQEDGSWALTCAPTPGLANEPTDGCTDARDWVFADGRIHDLRLYLDGSAVATLESSSTFDHPPAAGRLVFAGGEFPEVEVELKGGYGSFRDDLSRQKTGFKIDLHTATVSREWHGLEKITLNNMVQDPTFLHENLTYELYRQAGVPAPRVSYARVWVNDVYFGFYSVIEAVDDRFLDTFVGGGGHLLEAGYGPDFDPGDFDDFEYDEGPDEAAGRQMVETLAQLLRTSSWDEGTLATVDVLVDLDEVMLAMAVEAASWNWDGYTTENNSYWYVEPATGRWMLMPHGVDQTWTGGWPNPWDDNERPVLYDFCLHVQSCRARYSAALLQVADALDASNLGARLDTLITLTEPEFLADPRKENGGDRQEQLAATRSRLQGAAGALRAAAN